MMTSSILLKLAGGKSFSFPWHLIAFSGLWTETLPSPVTVDMTMLDFEFRFPVYFTLYPFTIISVWLPRGKAVLSKVKVTAVYL